MHDNDLGFSEREPLMDVVDVNLVRDLLVVGTMGGLFGIALSLAFRLVAYLFDMVRVVIL